MGALGLPGLVGQMGREVPGPIWVLNVLSPVCLPSWFGSHVTWPGSERSSDCTVQGVHIRCALTPVPTTSTTRARRLPSPWPDKPSESICAAAVNQTVRCTHPAHAVSCVNPAFALRCSGLSSARVSLPHLCIHSTGLLYKLLLSNLTVSDCNSESV